MFRRGIVQSLLVVALAVCLLGQPTVVTAQGQSPRVEVIIGFHQPPGAEQVRVIEGLGGQIMWAFRILPAVAVNIPEAALSGILQNPRVRYVEPNYEVYAHGQVIPWGIARVFEDSETEPAATWDTCGKGAGVKVGVIDSGIDLDHPDLSPIAGGTHFYTLGRKLKQDSTYDDDNGHGTHVSGTIAARDNDIGVVGVAPAVDLYAIKVLGANGSGSVLAVAAGVEWAITQGLDVINMSLGSSSDSETLRKACDAAYNAGIVIVASAGNSGAGVDTVGYPAKYSSVIAVAASDSTNTRASFSSTGPAVELTAPGVDILSTVVDGLYEAGWSGTSMASPHVAGAAALVLARNPALPPASVRLALVNTSLDLGTAGLDEWYGFGLIRANLAVEAAAAMTPPSDPPGTTGTLHIAALDGKATPVNPKKWLASVVITVKDNENGLFAGATVRGTWSTGIMSTATTGSDGTCTVGSGNISTSIGSVTFNVTSVSATGHTYDAENSITTTIVQKP